MLTFSLLFLLLIDAVQLPIATSCETCKRPIHINNDSSCSRYFLEYGDKVGLKLRVFDGIEAQLVYTEWYEDADSSGSDQV